MAFEIIRLTEEEQKEFAKRGIKNPNPYRSIPYTLSIPLYLTIDRERDIMLFCEGENRDDWVQQYFVYIHKEKVITFLAEYSVVESGHVKYRIYEILNGMEMTEEDRVNLQEAFDLYQVSGDDDVVDTKVTLVFEV